MREEMLVSLKWRTVTEFVRSARLNITVQKWRDIVSDQKQKCQTHVCECQSIDHRVFIKLPLSLKSSTYP